MPDRDASTSGSSAARTAVPEAAVAEASEAQKIHRFVHGVDDKARGMTDDEIATELNDPFALLLLRKGVFPATVIEVLEGVDAATPDGDPLRQQMSFIVGEG